MKYRIIASLLLVLVLALLAIQQEGKDNHTGTTSIPSLSNDEAAFKSLKIN